MANISIDGRLDLSDLRYQKIPTGKAEHFLLKKGDLLLNWRSGSAHHVGKTALFNGDGDYTCASFILRIRVRPQKANNSYLRHVLNFMRGEGLFKVSSRMQINSKLNARQFQEFPVRFPGSLQEQEVIAARLDAAESIVWARSEMLIGSVQQTSALSHAILGKAFAGEL